MKASDLVKLSKEERDKTESLNPRRDALCSMPLGSTRGQAVMEFILFLPILMALLIFAFEWSQLFIKQMRVSTLCREMTLLAHKQCITSLSPTETEEQCINRIQGEVLAEQTNSATATLPEFSTRGGVILSLYHLAAGNDVTTGDNGGYSTQYSRATLNQLDANLLNNFGTVAVGEFYYRNQMAFALQQFIDFIMPTTIYKSTVI